LPARWKRIWISWTNKPVFDEEGRVVEVLCVGNDITEIRERKRAQRSGGISERGAERLSGYIAHTQRRWLDHYINPRFGGFRLRREEFIGFGIEEAAEKKSSIINEGGDDEQRGETIFYRELCKTSLNSYKYP
jgi:hypothetical protein